MPQEPPSLEVLGEMRQKVSEFFDKILKLTLPEPSGLSHFFGFKSRSSSLIKLWNEHIKKHASFSKSELEFYREPEHLEPLFFLLASFEKNICQFVNASILSKLNHSETIQDNRIFFERIIQLDDCLKDLNLLLVEMVEPLLELEQFKYSDAKLLSELQRLSQKIVFADIKLSASEPLFKTIDAQKSYAEAMNGVRRLIMALLLKESVFAKGRSFISNFSQQLEGDRVLINPLLRPEEHKDCMSVAPAGDTDLFYPVIENPLRIDESHTMDARMNQRMRYGSGGNSVIFVPLYFSEDVYSKFAAMDAEGITCLCTDFAKRNYNEHLRNMLQSSFFVLPSSIQYALFSIQILHELVHVYNNAAGKNLRAVPLAKEQLSTWTTCEEFHAICGGRYSEAEFAKSYGIIQQRLSHGSSEILENILEQHHDRTIRDLIMSHLSSIPDSVEAETTVSKLK